MCYRRSIATVVVGLSFLIGNVPNPVSARQATSLPLPGFQVFEASIDDVHAALRSKRVTCRALVELYLERIEAYDKAGPSSNAVQTINPHARQEADRLDAAVRVLWPPFGSLHCIPVLVKDQVETSDMPTTYGSAVFKDFVPQRDATVVTQVEERWRRDCREVDDGRVRVRVLQLRVRTHSERLRSEAPRERLLRWNRRRRAGELRDGRHRGGYRRIDARSCGSEHLVGLRPTVPLVSRHGMFPARPTTDTLGPITRTVQRRRDRSGRDCWLRPQGPCDRVRRRTDSPFVLVVPRARRAQGARIGVIRQPMDAKTDPARRTTGR